MFKKISSTLLAGVVMFCFAVSVHADNWAWNGSVNSDWHNAGNWSNASYVGLYPGETLSAGYQFLDNNSLVNGATPPTVSTNLPFKAFDGHVNVFGSGTIKIVAGGNINMHSDVSIGRNGGNGTVLVEGGDLTLDGFLVKGGNGTEGLLEMTGGNVAWSNLRIATNDAPTNAKARVNLWGGELSANQINFANTSQTEQVIDIQNGGLLVLDGDQTTDVTGWAAGSAADGLISGSNGIERLDLEALGTVGMSGDLRWVFSQNDDQTFAWATGAPAGGNEVPEPASIAIWSILGLCLAGYGYRRRRRNG